MRYRPLAALLVALAVCASCTGTTPPPSERPGQPPDELAEGLFRCLPPHAIVGINDLAFPPGHPEYPRSNARPDRCFGSIAEADEAGYPIASPPRGTTLVAGMYLSENREAASVCTDALKRVDFPLLCPTLLPVGIALQGEPLIRSGMLVFQSGFPGPFGYRGVPGGQRGHFVFATAPATKFDAPFRKQPHLTCFRAKKLTVERITSRRVQLLACPQGSALHSEHLLLKWVGERVGYVISLHTDTSTNRRLLTAIARTVEIIHTP